MKTKLGKKMKKLLRRKNTSRTATRVLVGAGATLAVAGAVGAALKVASSRKNKKKAATPPLLRADPDAADTARWEDEGGHLQAVVPTASTTLP